jgi:hypothetical protein
VDLAAAVFSEATDELAETIYIDARERRYARDKSFAADRKWLESKFPGKEVGSGSRTLDAKVWLVTANSDTEPGETYLFDRTTHKLTFQYKLWEKLPRDALAEMKPVSYTSSDGLEIPAYLTLPKGLAPKGLPALVIPHGGPSARDFWGFNGLAQFFANRGYAVLMPNFRGSTGYGKKFLDAGNGEWGRKMQDDLTWGVKYPCGTGRRGSEACRHSRWFLRRLRHSCRSDIHTRSVRRRSGHRRSLRFAVASGIHSAVLGSSAKDSLLAGGRSHDARWQSATRSRVAPSVRQ